MGICVIVYCNLCNRESMKQFFKALLMGNFNEASQKVLGGGWGVSALPISLYFPEQRLQGIVFGLAYVFPHHSFTEIRVFQLKGHDDFAVALHGPFHAIRIFKGILPISQYIFSDVHHQSMKLSLVCNDGMKCVMEPGIQSKHLIDSSISQGFFGLLDEPAESFKNLVRNSF